MSNLKFLTEYIVYAKNIRTMSFTQNNLNFATCLLERSKHDWWRRLESPDLKISSANGEAGRYSVKSHFPSVLTSIPVHVPIVCHTCHTSWTTIMIDQLGTEIGKSSSHLQMATPCCIIVSVDQCRWCHCEFNHR